MIEQSFPVHFQEMKTLSIIPSNLETLSLGKDTSRRTLFNLTKKAPLNISNQLLYQKSPRNRCLDSHDTRKESSWLDLLIVWRPGSISWNWSQWHLNRQPSQDIQTRPRSDLFLWLLLEFSCFSCVVSSYTAKRVSYMYTYIPSLSQPEHWVEFPGLYSRFLLVICFKHSSVYMSIAISLIYSW